MAKVSAKKARELALESSDCSFLLTHLIRQNDGKSDTEAKRIFLSILDIQDGKIEKAKLKASSTGWYSTASSTPIYGYDRDEIIDSLSERVKAVCFTESTFSGLIAHRNLFNVKYAIAFSRETMLYKGANPCINIHKNLFRKEIYFDGRMFPDKHLYNYIPIDLIPFINVINEHFDATYEREWRYPGDFNFSRDDIVFLFCPKEDFPLFSKVQKDGSPVLFDLAWLDKV